MGTEKNALNESYEKSFHRNCFVIIFALKENSENERTFIMKRTKKNNNFNYFDKCVF